MVDRHLYFWRQVDMQVYYHIYQGDSLVTSEGLAETMVALARELLSSV